MSKRKIDLDELLRQIEDCERRAAISTDRGRMSGASYWLGRADGLNRVDRFLTTGEWET